MSALCKQTGCAGGIMHICVGGVLTICCIFCMYILLYMADSPR